MQYMGGGTNTADGIKYLRENVFSQTGGARSNVPRIAVVITDGRSANPTQTTTQANLARQDNIGKFFKLKKMSTFLLAQKYKYFQKKKKQHSL